MDNRYTLEFERAIYNFRLGGDDASLNPVANAFRMGIENGMEVLVPVHLAPKDISTPGLCLKDGDSSVFANYARFDGADCMVGAYTSEKELAPGDLRDVVCYRMSDLVSKVNEWSGCTGIIINPHNMAFNLHRELLDQMGKRPLSSTFEVVRGSVLNMHVGAIVNAANRTLLGGGGVDGAIHRLAGPGLLEECRGYGGCKTGDAVITGSYNIDHTDAIIHTVGPIYSGRPQDRIDLANCYLNSMQTASENGIRSIAFPCISTGAYGFPLGEAAKIAVMALTEWFDRNPEAVMNVYLCCFRDEEYRSYMNILN